MCHRRETRRSAAPFLPLASPMATAFTTKRSFRPSRPLAVRESAGDPGPRSSTFQEDTGTALAQCAPPPHVILGDGLPMIEAERPDPPSEGTLGGPTKSPNGRSRIRIRDAAGDAELPSAGDEESRSLC